MFFDYGDTNSNTAKKHMTFNHDEKCPECVALTANFFHTQWLRFGMSN